MRGNGRDSQTEMLQDIKGISEIELSAIYIWAKSLEKGRDLAGDSMPLWIRITEPFWNGKIWILFILELSIK